MSNLPPPHDQAFDSLDRILSDPAVDLLLGKARQTEALVNAIPDTLPAERNALIHELDREWTKLGYMGVNMQVAGWLLFPEEIDRDTRDEDQDGSVQYPVADSEPKRYKIVTRYYDGVVMRSNGFCWIQDNIELDGSVIPQFRVGFDVVRIDDGMQDVLREGAGLIDKVAFDYPHVSAEHARDRLGYFYPELMEQVDTIALNKLTEEEAFRALSEVRFSVDNSDPIHRQTIIDLGNYATSIIPFDRSLPYQIRLDGVVCLSDNNGGWKRAKAKTSTSLCTPYSIRFISFGQTEEGTRKKIYVPAVELDLHQHDYDLPPHRIYAPPSVVKNFLSVRRIVYGDHSRASS